MSGWTVDTLKEHFETLLNEKDKALAAALVAVKQENQKTEIQAEKRFDLLNELRQGVATKTELQALEKVVNEIKDRLTLNEGSIKGSQLTMGKIYAALAAAVSLIGIFIFLTQ